MYAFPTLHQNGITGYIPPESSGMTLRDYFAAKALMAILTHEQGLATERNLAAKGAYAYADAMMEARNVAQ